jgi:hypothetical protein
MRPGCGVVGVVTKTGSSHFRYAEGERVESPLGNGESLPIVRMSNDL